MRLNSPIFLPVLLIVAAAFTGCSSDDGTSPQADEGFVASLDDLRDFETWTLTDYTIYPTALDGLGEAHAGNNPEVARMIYTHPDAGKQNDQWRRGSLIVKETFNWRGGRKERLADGGLLAMSKRAGNYDMDYGGWEYIMMNPAGDAIVGRGNDLMGNMCRSCHTGATEMGGMDFVFKHPAEYAVPAGGEWDFFDDAVGTWEKVDAKFGPDPFLSGAHGVADDFNRDIYRWQPAAQFAGGRFPVGTAILKEVYKMEGGQKVYPPNGDGGWTAMVKRGGNFNGEHGHWEWFMINPLTQSVARGGDLMDNMCNSCHSNAASGGGGDYVFRHPNMGFPN